MASAPPDGLRIMPVRSDSPFTRHKFCPAGPSGGGCCLRWRTCSSATCACAASCPSSQAQLRMSLSLPQPAQL